MARRSYHFSLGNSNTGPVGFCARIWAHSKPEAVTSLKEYLGQELEAHTHLSDDERRTVEYITVYFNPEVITEQDIDEVD